MLSINNLDIQFAGKHLFKNISVQVNQGMRIGLVGVNGAGKSTLLRIMAGEIETDPAVVSCASWSTMPYLPQEVEQGGRERTLFAEAESGLCRSHCGQDQGNCRALGGNKSPRGLGLNGLPPRGKPFPPRPLGWQTGPGGLETFPRQTAFGGGPRELILSGSWGPPPRVGKKRGGLGLGNLGGFFPKGPRGFSQPPGSLWFAQGFFPRGGLGFQLAFLDWLGRRFGFFTKGRPKGPSLTSFKDGNPNQTILRNPGDFPPFKPLGFKERKFSPLGKNPLIPPGGSPLGG